MVFLLCYILIAIQFVPEWGEHEMRRLDESRKADILRYINEYYDRYGRTPAVRGIDPSHKHRVYHIVK